MFIAYARHSTMPVNAGMRRASFRGAGLIIEHRFAEEKWKSRFKKTAKENYHEMGLLSLSVVFYTLKNGQQAIDMYIYFNSF
jgi:hypothetical protein